MQFHYNKEKAGRCLATIISFQISEEMVVIFPTMGEDKKHMKGSGVYVLYAAFRQGEVCGCAKIGCFTFVFVFVLRYRVDFIYFLFGEKEQRCGIKTATFLTGSIISQQNY